MPRRRDQPAPVTIYIPAGVDLVALGNRADAPKGYNPDVSALLLATLLGRVDPNAPNAYVPLKAAYLRVCHRDYPAYMRMLLAADVLRTDGYFVTGRKSYGFCLRPPLRADEQQPYKLTRPTAIRAYERRNDRAATAMREVRGKEPMQVRGQTQASAIARQVGRERLLAPHTDRYRYPFSAEHLLLPSELQSVSPNLHQQMLQMECQMVGGRPRKDVTYRGSEQAAGGAHVGDWLIYDAPNAPDCSAWAQSATATLRRDQSGTMRHLYDCLCRVEVAPGWVAYLDDLIAAGGQLARKARYQRRAVAILVEAVRRGTPRFSRSATNGRLDTPVTNLRKDLRRFLRMRGAEELVSLDVQTCQPFLAIRIMAEAERIGIAPHGTTAAWQSAVLDGDLYQALATELGVSREAAKAAWFKVLFGYDGVRSPARDAFKRRFPGAALVVAVEKRKSTKALALRLQRMEAMVMLERVAPHLAAERIPCLTVHDSLIVPMENSERSVQVLRSEFRRVAGAEPAIVMSALEAHR